MPKKTQSPLAITGRQVAAMRAYRSLTQEQLSAKAGISIPTLNAIEQGKNFTIGNLMAVMAALECYIDITFTPIEN